MPHNKILRIRFDSDGTFGTVADLVAARLRARAVDLYLGNICPKTHDRAVHYLNSFAVDYGDWKPSSCGNDELLEWISEHTEWESPSTRINAAAEVISAFSWASDKHKTRYGAFTRRALKLAPATPRTPIIAKEYADLLRIAKYARGSRKSKTALRIACYFLWETGARTCEMFKLEARHVKLKDGIAILDEHKSDATGLSRIIYLPRGVRLLLRFLMKRWPTGPLFRNSWRRAWCAPTFARLFRRYASLSGVRPEVSPYSLRHAFCVRSLNGGNGDRQTADIMGQVSTNYVRWYGRTAKSSVDYLRGIRERF